MTTLETLQELLLRQYPLSRDVPPEAQLAALGVDSLGLIELMFQIEDRFGITLPDDKLPVLVTVQDLVTYIDQLVAVRAAVSIPGK